jgi:hypothetical protein
MGTPLLITLACAHANSLSLSLSLSKHLTELAWVTLGTLRLTPAARTSGTCLGWFCGLKSNG